MVQINGWHRSRNYQHQATQSWIKYVVLAIIVCTWCYSISGINNQFQKVDLNVNSKRHPYQASSQQKCRPLRDVSHYSTSTVHYPIDNPSTGRQNSKYDSCLQGFSLKTEPHIPNPQKFEGSGPEASKTLHNLPSGVSKS